MCQRDGVQTSQLLPINDNSILDFNSFSLTLNDRLRKELSTFRSYPRSKSFYQCSPSKKVTLIMDPPLCLRKTKDEVIEES